MSTTPSPFQTLNLRGVLSESKRIVNAHSRHFLALSVLFLLPLSFSLIIYPTLQTTLYQSNAIRPQSFLFHPSSSSSSPQSGDPTLPLLYALFVFVLALCAFATITYSTYHGFYGRPVKFISAIKSLIYSFLPLVATTLAAQLIVSLICAAFALFVGLVVLSIEKLSGSEIDYSSNYFAGFCVPVAIVLGLVLIRLQVDWALACVVVVTESKWGFEPLRRSTYLIRGMRFVSLSLILFFGFCIGFLAWGSSDATANLGSIGCWKSLAFVFQTVIGSTFVTLLMLHNIASSTVLYMYCKAFHGELAFEIAEEFAREYVSLPFDDGKVPHVVSIVEA